MADNKPNTRRGELGADFQIDELDLRRRKIEGALPAHFVQEYPEFIKFLTVYYEFLEAEDGLDRMIERLRDVRNTDIADGEFVEHLMCEYGDGFPENTSLNDQNALKIFHQFFKSKGNQEAIVAYFRLFLNSEAEVVYPKDNMLRVSDGNWDDTANRWIDQQGHLSESSMVIQDSNFYQLYSYLIRSDQSIADWGSQFREILHPAGWNLFGEVRIESLARFEEFREVTLAGNRSPTIVPGFQTRDSNVLILGSALYFLVKNTQPSPNNHNMRAIKQFIKKAWKIVLAPMDVCYDLQHANKNLLVSTYALYDLGQYTIQQIDDETINKTVDIEGAQRPARIDTSNLLTNPSFQTDLTGWTQSLSSNGTAVVNGGALDLTITSDAGTTPRVYQSLSCEVGETYVVYARGRVSAGNQGLAVNNSASGTSIAGANTFDIAINTSTDTQLFAVSFTATETTHNVILYTDGADGAVGTFDYVCARKVSL